MKHTRRIKKNKTKGKTRKFYGGKNTSEFEQSPGIFDIVGDKLADYSANTRQYLAEKGLRLVGLQPINKNENVEIDNDNVSKVDNKINELSNAASGTVSGFVSGVKEIGSDIVNVADKSSAALIEQVNDVLESPKVENSINEALEETTVIGEKILENVNEKLSSPEMKEQAKMLLDNVGDYANIAVESLNEPLDRAIDSLNEAGTQAISGASSGVIKVGTDALAAIPGFGAIVELGKIANDASAAVGDVVEAGTQAVSTLSKVVDETSKNINEGLEKLEEKKQEIGNNLNKFKEMSKDGKKINNRINKSIDNFENPFPSTSGGGGKTRSKYSKKMAKKTKRVRFAL